MKKARGIKASFVIGISLAVITVALLVVGIIFDATLLLSAAACALFCCYLVLRNCYIAKKLDKIFNALLDFYDQLDTFAFSPILKREVLDCMKACRREFSENNNLNGCENCLAQLVKIAINSSEDAKQFVNSHEVLSEFINVYEE